MNEIACENTARTFAINIACEDETFTGDNNVSPFRTFRTIAVCLHAVRNEKANKIITPVIST